MRDPNSSQTPFLQKHYRSVWRGILLTAIFALGIYGLAWGIVKVEPWFRADPPPSFMEASPKVGEEAPSFVLRNIQGKIVALEDLLGNKPVLILFGSYSCPYCVWDLQKSNDLAEKYKGKLNCVFVYCQEAHPETLPLTHNWEQRSKHAATVQTLLPAFGNILIDEAGDLSAQSHYGGLPYMGFLLDEQGHIEMKQVLYNPLEVESELLQSLALE